AGPRGRTPHADRRHHPPHLERRPLLGLPAARRWHPLRKRQAGPGRGVHGRRDADDPRPLRRRLAGQARRQEPARPPLTSDIVFARTLELGGRRAPAALVSRRQKGRGAEARRRSHARPMPLAGFAAIAAFAVVAAVGVLAGCGKKPAGGPGGPGGAPATPVQVATVADVDLKDSSEYL